MHICVGSIEKKPACQAKNGLKGIPDSCKIAETGQGTEMLDVHFCGRDLEPAFQDILCPLYVQREPF
jgi:hypothetical protein